MDEDNAGDDKDDSKRRTRNLSEKKRRDQFNMLVNELSSMVSTNNKKMDKSTVLKATISFLRNHNEITVRSRAHDVQEDWKPTFLSNEEFTYLMLEALEGFVMLFSANGTIYYVSESISSLLGHNPAMLVNQSIFDLTFEHDRPNLYSILQNPNTSAADVMQSATKENAITFQCHLRRGSLDFRDEMTYELVQFIGHFRPSLEQVDTDDNMTGYQDHESRLLFMCTCRLHTPQLIRDVSMVDSNHNEFTSRHSLEWKFLFLDQRAPHIIGYLPFEVLGTSVYDYYHFDDLEKVVTCHEALMQKGELTSCYYRFLTKGQQWIWLQTRFYITYHQWNSKPEFVVCTHRVVSYSDIIKSTKQEGLEREGLEMDTLSEVETSREVIKDAPSEDTMVTMSPSYISEASDALGNYHVSQPASVKSISAGSTTGTVATTATAGTSWARNSHTRYNAGSDTASLSGGSRSSQRNSSRELMTNAALCGGNYQQPSLVRLGMFSQIQKAPEPALVPQHGIGAQYLDPVPYVSSVGVPGVLPLSLPPLPVLVSPDHAQMQRRTNEHAGQLMESEYGVPRTSSNPQVLDALLSYNDEGYFEEQLQRKHEELQQMIVQQQEELRQVKEQLLLARLGMLQPIINVQNPYITATPDDTHNRPGQYEASPSRPPYPAPQHHHPQYPPHSSHHQHNMPQ